MKDYHICSAVIRDDGVYRYSLTRAWGDTNDFKTLVFCMLNPSTADAEKDDPTIRRCVGFANREGYNKILVVNTHALKDGVDWCEMCVRRPSKTRKPNLDAPCPNKTTGR